MIFGFGKSRGKDVQPISGDALRPAFVCSHILEGMKGGSFEGFISARDEEGDMSAVCNNCKSATDVQTDFKIVGEGQALSYAKLHGVKI